MIKDAKFVKSVTSNTPKKGWKIEWADGKFDNIFDEAWLPILDEAQKTNRLVAFEKEKNNAGYWDIIKLKLVDLPDTGSPPVQKPPAETPPKSERPNTTNNSIESQVAFKGIVELIVADKVKVNGLVGVWALSWAMDKLGAATEDIKKLADAEVKAREKEIKGG